MIFCEYREAVHEAYAILLQNKPLIKPKVFMGQSSITQRQQMNVKLYHISLQNVYNILYFYRL